MSQAPSQDNDAETNQSPSPSPTSRSEQDLPVAGRDMIDEDDHDLVQGSIVEPTQKESNARTRLLEDYHKAAACGSRDCNHGTFSPRMRSYPNSISSEHDFGGRFGASIGEDGGDSDRRRGLLGDTFVGGLFGGPRRGSKMSTTQWLAAKHGVSNQKLL